MCEPGILIGHDYHKLIAVCHLWQRIKNFHGVDLEWAAGWKKFEMLCWCFVHSAACAFEAFVYSCVNIIGHMWPSPCIAWCCTGFVSRGVEPVMGTKSGVKGAHVAILEQLSVSLGR